MLSWCSPGASARRMDDVALGVSSLKFAARLARGEMPAELPPRWTEYSSAPSSIAL